MIPEIDKKFEKFDVQGFDKKIAREHSKKYTTKNDEFYLEEEIQSPGYISRLYYKNSYFTLIKKFFENGNIQEKAVSFNSGYPIGFWYKFDEKGNLIEEIDTDLGFDFGWEKVIAYCEENKIPLTKGYETSGFQTTVYKEEVNGSKVWRITFQTAGDKLLEITLNGKTGKELNKKELEFVNH